MLVKQHDTRVGRIIDVARIDDPLSDAAGAPADPHADPFGYPFLKVRRGCTPDTMTFTRTGG